MPWNAADCHSPSRPTGRALRTAWLPATAESSQVLDMQARVQSPDVYPAVVVYDRPSPITAADRAKAAQDIERFGSVQGAVKSGITGPVVASDGRAIQSIVPVDVKGGGWEKAVPAADSLRHIAQSGSHGMAVHITGPLGNAADSSKAFAGIDSTLLLAALAVVIVLLLVTYRSPALWLFR